MTRRPSILLPLLGVALQMVVSPLSYAQIQPDQSQLSQITIDDVEVLGVNAIASDEIEDAIEIETGKPLDAKAIEESVAHLRDLYRTAGYEDAKFKVKIYRRATDSGAVETEVVARFEVIEGLPVRVGGIEWTLDGTETENQKEWWNQIRKEIPGRFGMQQGDVASLEKMAAGSRAVLDYIKGQDLIFAQISTPQIVVQNMDDSRKGAPPAAKWVNIVMQVKLGEKIGFGFRGNEAVSTFRLNSIIEEQRGLGVGKDFLSVMRSKISDEYLSIGYNHATIEVVSREDREHARRHFTFRISEGPRVSLAKVEFDGNRTFSDSRLQEVFFEGASDPVKNGIFLERDLQKAAEWVVDWLKSHGYLFARLVTTKTVYPPPAPDDSPLTAARKKSQGTFVVYLHEGDQTVLRSLTLSGITVFAPEEVAQLLGLDEGAPLNLARFTEGIERLKGAYRAKGYLRATLKNENDGDLVKYSQENHFADIHIEVSEGLVFRAAAVEWRGLEKTRQDVVERELQIKPGEVIEDSKLAETERRLRLLGVFSQVTIRLEEVESDIRTSTTSKSRGQMKVIVAVDEASPGIVAGGLGFRTDLGIRAFGQFGYTNLMGRNHTALLNLNVNRRIEDYRFVEGSAQLSYLWPWFLGDKTTFRPSLTAQAQQFISFDAKIVTGAITFDRKLVAIPAISAAIAYTLEFADLTIRKAELRDYDQSSPLIGSLIPSIRLDTRDNPLNPSKGIFSSLTFEIASPWLGSQSKPYPVAYTRTVFRSDFHVTLPFDLRWYGSFRTGYARNLASPVYDPATGLRDPKSGILPLTKHFFLGGANSVRGYKENDINQITIGVEGTLSYVNYRTQLSFPVAPGGNWRIGPFLDAANLNVDTYSFGDLKFGAGLSFSYISPLGSLNLDVAGRLSAPASDSDRTEFIRAYFSIGFI